MATWDPDPLFPKGGFKDLDPKWPNVVDPCGSGSGSGFKTLLYCYVLKDLVYQKLNVVIPKI